MTLSGLVGAARARTARYARMTAEDATELAAVFWQVARRQASDAAAGVGPRLARSVERARNAATRR